MPDSISKNVLVTAGPARLPGTLTLPLGTQGVVVFAHGSGSSRHSPRNRFVAQSLNARGLGTLLFDLLTPDEEAVDIHGVLSRKLQDRRWPAVCYIKHQGPPERQRLVNSDW